jgi:hypothetical protein
MLTAFGALLFVGTLVFAFVRSGEPKDPEADWVWWDSWNIAGHWRGWLKIAAAMILIGLLGQVAVAVAS